MLTEIKEKIQKLSKCVISFILFCTNTTVKVLAVIHMANLFRFGDSVLSKVGLLSSFDHIYIKQ